MINSGSAGPMLLGTFDEEKEIMRVDQKLGPQVLDSSGTCERALAAAPCPLDLSRVETTSPAKASEGPARVLTSFLKSLSQRLPAA